ncbi:MAG: cytochrome P450 [Mycolicibacterium hassiacum]|jgi:cytochrome P450|uniref:cytochrome P450 n=1 Tax=Mycolicibacterium hassiacum TaxID=46351 RepID=UPI0023F638E8|nr:cytochrome P450 [Mycolicibacterium hassiacum]MBX5487987.1 cytochrome P450 [Mycolicibacterium hassiacum]
MEYNPLTPAMAEDPFPTFKWLRDNAPVYYNRELDFYALSRYDDVLAASLDHETYCSGKGISLEGLEQGLDSLITKDEPEHGWNRRILVRQFSAGRVAELEPRIRRVCTELLDQAVQRGSMDVVTEFSSRLPMQVIGEMMGLPAQQRDTVHDLCNRMLTREGAPSVRELPEDAVIAGAELFGLMYQLVQDRRARPGEDLISLLVHTPVVDDAGNESYLRDEVLCGRLIELAVAGHETVMKLVASGTAALWRNPDQRAELCADPSLIPNAIEEMLRYEPPSVYQGRVTTRDVELHGTVIPEGSRVLLLTGAAVRDERQYPDPDRFDIHRRIGRQLSFGYGVHLCLGAHLARMESRIAFEELLRRFPDYEIDWSRMRYTYGSSVRGYRNLVILPRKPASVIG